MVLQGMKFVGYLRVSSEEQKKGVSIDTQRKKIEEYAQFKDWKISKFYEDAGISGTSINKRKAFQQMIKDAEDEKFTGIIVTKFDRAFRNVIDALTTIEKLNKLKIDIISIAENIDTTNPMGKAMFTIVSTFAELESGRNAERVRDVRKYRFEQGMMVGRSPFGYRTIKKAGKVVGFRIHQKEAEIVSDCFKMTSEGYSYREVCKKHKLKPQQYYNIVKNKVYCGYVIFEGKEKKGTHEPIISEELYNQVNKN